MRTLIDIICIILASSVSFVGGYVLGRYNEQQNTEKGGEE